ncbi:MAG TPA: carbonic anhydrase family protein [Thermoanaerobaculia bacterium]|nr:carbonic anhydrase family protein [Thermoanaerobaculia bacterium]
MVAVLFAAALPSFGQCIEKWNYDDNSGKGPKDWYRLDRNWGVCRTGTRQSPINVTGSMRKQTGPLAFNKVKSTFTVDNKGQKLEVTVSPDWTLHWNGQEAKLQEFHVHVPAEHTYQGVRNGGEIHFVYALPSGGAVAVGVWLQAGPRRTPPNPTLRKIIAVKPASCQRPQHSNEQIAMLDFLLNPQRYVTYEGSLTTPGCTEDVTFAIAIDPLVVPAEQIQALAILPDLPLGNARPLQRTKARK